MQPPLSPPSLKDILAKKQFQRRKCNPVPASQALPIDPTKRGAAQQAEAARQATLGTDAHVVSSRKVGWTCQFG